MRRWGKKEEGQQEEHERNAERNSTLPAMPGSLHLGYRSNSPLSTPPCLQPNTGDISDEGLLARLKANAADGIYTTLIGEDWVQGGWRWSEFPQQRCSS